MKLRTKFAALMAALVATAIIFNFIASGLSIDRIMLAARPVVDAVSVFSHYLG
ncbi:MAG: hypothetical protein QME28_09500 [Candidatus Saccharicenans sp.]|nr:hypothetical protein [Candidatus Saccharicenans sp.]